LLGVGGELHHWGDATACKVAFFHRHVDGDVAGATKHIDAQGDGVVGGCLSHRCRAAGSKAQDEGGGDEFVHGLWGVLANVLFAGLFLFVVGNAFAIFHIVVGFGEALILKVVVANASA